MSKSRITAVIIGLALLGLAWAIDGIWDNPEPLVLWTVFGLSATSLLFAAFWPKSRGTTPPQPGHRANVTVDQSTAGRDLTVNVGDHFHFGGGTIEPSSERDLNAEQGVAQNPPQTEAVSYDEWKHWPKVDLPTAAAIWSGSWDTGNAHRHVCFRNLKWAIRHGHLSAHELNGDGPNIRTTVTPVRLKEFFDHWTDIRSSRPLEDPRLRLAQLRTKGVQIRNSASEVSTSVFLDRADEWANEAAYQVENIDPPDAEWFRTLDAVPPPRIIPPGGLSEQGIKRFRELDFELSKLEELIQKYGRG